MMRTFAAYMAVFLVAFILIFSPLGHGGKLAFSQMVVEWAGWLTLLFVFWSGVVRGKVSRPVLWFIVVCFLILGLYLVPLPETVWSSLPGRELYIRSASWLESVGGEVGYRTLSIIPLSTVGFVLACVPALAIFLVACSVPMSQLSWLVYAAIACAGLQGGLAMLQFFGGNSYWYFGLQASAPMGTYLNQNHLTALMEMVEPLTMALIIYALVNMADRPVRRLLTVLLLSLFSLLLVFVPMISSSRTGVALLFLGIILSFWAMTTPELRKRVAAPIIGLRLIVLALAVIVQLGIIRSVSKVVSADMAPSEVLGDLRWRLWSSSFEGVQALFPFGSGPSTFAKVYKAYQPEDFGALLSHVHNDYLELLFEFGVFGVLILLGFWALYIYQWRYVLRLPDAGMPRLLQSGAGVGVLLFALYSLTDFNLHTPANVWFFVFLLAIFFRRLSDDSEEWRRPGLPEERLPA